MLVQVYVLMFGVGSAAVEGVHTIRAMDVDHGSASDTVVAFEAHDDAERYAHLSDLLTRGWQGPCSCPVESCRPASALPQTACL